MKYKLFEQLYVFIVNISSFVLCWYWFGWKATLVLFLVKWGIYADLRINHKR